MIRRFFRKLFLTVGFIVVIVTLLGYGAGFYRYQKSLHLPERILLTVDFTQPLAENPQSSPLPAFAGGGEAGISTTDLVRTLDKARRDSRVGALLATFGNAEPGLAQVQEVRGALERFKASGKKMIAYAPSFGEMTPADKSFYIAAQFNEIWLQPGGLVGLTGIGLQVPFLRGLLDEVGIKPDVLTRKAYKTAMASATDKTFTPEHRAMMNQLLDTLYPQLVEGIATGRKLPPETVKSLIDKGPLTAQEALDAKLIDKIAYADEASTAAIEAAGQSPTGKGAKKVGWTDYAYVISKRPVKEIPAPAPKNSSIAIVHVNGMIHQGDSMQNPFGGFETSGADTIVEALDQARKDKDVKVVILRIDSPGGSAVASETIRRAVKRLDAVKPVIVSMGSVAASGGYWIATGTKTIIADPATLTGSIGVLAGKFTIGDLLKRFNVNLETLQRGAHADMWSTVTPFSADARARMNLLLDNIYDDFKSRVMEARGLDAAAAERVAQGRVWTGAEAKDLKLVDELGGLDFALVRAKQKIGIDPETPAYVMDLPQQPSPADQLRNVLQMLMSTSITMGKLQGAIAYMNMPQGAALMPALDVK